MCTHTILLSRSFLFVSRLEVLNCILNAFRVLNEPGVVGNDIHMAKSAFMESSVHWTQITAQHNQRMLGKNEEKNWSHEKILSTIHSNSSSNRFVVMIFSLSTTSHFSCRAIHRLPSHYFMTENIIRNNQLWFQNTDSNPIQPAGIHYNGIALSAIVMAFTTPVPIQFLRRTQTMHMDWIFWAWIHWPSASGMRLNGGWMEWERTVDSYIKLANKSLIKSSFVFVK